MSTQERRPPQRQSPAPPAPDTEQAPPSGAAGDAFLNAADAAIARALSGTPEAFLAQNRQLGGQ